MPATLIIKPRCRIFHGHEWIYASDVDKYRGAPQPGEIVALKSVKGRFLGSAIFNSHSQIVARRFSFRKEELDQDFFVRRLERAVEYRKTLPLDQSVCRLLWSEADGVPGVVIDRYGDHVALQTLTLAMDQRKDIIVAAIRQVLNPKSIIERNDTLIRVPEGMEQQKSVLFGEEPKPFSVKVGGIVLNVDLMEGQKTGLYLDQLDNYGKVARFAQGKRVLDCFTNQGGFAQACAKAGAAEVTAVDSSEAALHQAHANATAAGVHINLQCANVFDFLKEAEMHEQKYDLIVLDPPSFTRTKSSITSALRGYKEIHLRALQMLEPGGLLVTFTCSHHITGGDLRQVLIGAGADARRSLRRIDSYTQRADHPIICGIPETEYLRGYAVEVIGGW
jgi:23S rRNA (cytosine1962-C5)-methyltransferase